MLEDAKVKGKVEGEADAETIRIRYFRESNCYLVAHSFGAFIGVRVHPKYRFRKLIVVCPFLMRPGSA